MRVDVMLDLETLGTKVGAPIIQISAVAFDIETGEVFNEYDRKVDLGDSVSIDVDTLKWWLKTDGELLSNLLEDKDSSSLREALSDYWYFLARHSHKNDTELYVWSNGLGFDISMIDCQFDKHSLDKPYSFRNDSDMRTVVGMYCSKFNVSKEDLFSMFENETVKKHDALEDCKWQIKVLTHCWDELV